MYDWLGVPMFINTIATEDIVARLEAASFIVEPVETESQREGGRDIKFAWFTAEKRAALHLLGASSASGVRSAARPRS
jgi:hypothetical protein